MFYFRTNEGYRVDTVTDAAEFPFADNFSILQRFVLLQIFRNYVTYSYRNIFLPVKIFLTFKMKHIWNKKEIVFTIIFRYEVKNEPESKMHLVRSFGVKWHKSNMIVKPFIKSDLNKQLHLSGEILKKSLLSHITAGSSWLIIRDSTIFLPKSYTVNFLFGASWQTALDRLFKKPWFHLTAVHFCLYPVTSFCIKSKIVLLTHALRVGINFIKNSLFSKEFFNSCFVFWKFYANFDDMSLRDKGSWNAYEKYFLFRYKILKLAQKLTSVKAFVIILVASLPAGSAWATAGFAFVQFLATFFIAALCRNGNNHGNGNGEKFHIFLFFCNLMNFEPKIIFLNEWPASKLSWWRNVSCWNTVLPLQCDFGMPRFSSLITHRTIHAPILMKFYKTTKGDI